MIENYYNNNDMYLQELFEAIKVSDIDRINNIIDMYFKQICFDDCDKIGMTPLHYACVHDYNYDIICKLLSLVINNDLLCNRNIKDAYNRTPFMIATINKAEDIIEVMARDVLVDINCQDTERNTPLHVACMKKYKYVNIIKTILEYYDTPRRASWISASKKNINGDTPLMLTLEYTDNDICKNKTIWRMFFTTMNINKESDTKYLSSIFDQDFFKKLAKHKNINFLNFLCENIGEYNMKYLLNIQDKLHMKPIHYVLDQTDFTNSDKIMCQILISLGSTINSTILTVDAKGQTNPSKKNMITKIKDKLKKSKNIISAEEWQEKMSIC